MIGKRRAPRAALTVLLVAMMALSGCGGRPVGVMHAAGTAAPGTSKVYLSTPLGGELPLSFRAYGTVDGNGQASGLGRYVKPSDTG
ncbi:hypothetical protein ACC696_37895, partial [Rhizobium ruizarguesonis]